MIYVVILFLQFSDNLPGRQRSGQIQTGRAIPSRRVGTMDWYNGLELWIGTMGWNYGLVLGVGTVG
jgi:hypothetical protein